MSSLSELQKQLHDALRKHPKLHLNFQYPWSPEIFTTLLFVVEDYINGVYGDHDTDDLSDWFDRYRFFQSQNKH